MLGCQKNLILSTKFEECALDEVFSRATRQKEENSSIHSLLLTCKRMFLKPIGNSDMQGNPTECYESSRFSSTLLIRTGS